MMMMKVGGKENGLLVGRCVILRNEFVCQSIILNGTRLGGKLDGILLCEKFVH